MATTAFIGYPPYLPPGPDPYPFGRFNTSDHNYTGPIIQGIYYDYVHVGPYLEQIKTSCYDEIGPGINKWTYLVAECVMQNLANEQARANLASYSYMMTLWPAFISLFASLGPDASDAVYDNIFWGALLAMTSGAMAGFQTPPNVPHVLRTFNIETAQSLCKYGERALRGPAVNKVGRFSRSTQCGRAFSLSSWLVLALSFLGWVAFAGTFLYGLSRSFYYSTVAAPFYLGSIWFFMASLPACLEMWGRLSYNNVDLYEPGPSLSVAEPISRQTTSSEINPSSLTFQSLNSVANKRLVRARALVPDYILVENRCSVKIWWRIFCHQMHGRPYRVLVRPFEYNFLPMTLHGIVQFSRFTLLTVGFMLQSTFMLYPPQLVIAQSALLAIITIIPRILWPNYWTRDRRGADLVVFYDSPLAACGDDIEISST